MKRAVHPSNRWTSFSVLLWLLFGSILVLLHLFIIFGYFKDHCNIVWLKSEDRSLFNVTFEIFQEIISHSHVVHLELTGRVDKFIILGCLALQRVYHKLLYTFKNCYNNIIHQTAWWFYHCYEHSCKLYMATNCCVY